jgi:hypothetical protein
MICENSLFSEAIFLVWLATGVTPLKAASHSDVPAYLCQIACLRNQDRFIAPFKQRAINLQGTIMTSSIGAGQLYGNLTPF